MRYAHITPERFAEDRWRRGDNRQTIAESQRGGRR